MLRSRNVALLWLWPFCLASILAYGQASDPGQLRKAPPTAASQPANDQPGLDAPPLPPNAPRISKEARLEIIRNFETQLVYARTAFPMGTKGLLPEGRSDYAQRQRIAAGAHPLGAGREAGRSGAHLFCADQG